ncbi:MAG: hypothetical protein ACERKZ_01005 [Lachnotalea sp.]
MPSLIERDLLQIRTFLKWEILKWYYRLRIILFTTLGLFVLTLLQFAKQMPRVNSKCFITSISASNYVLLYEAEEKENLVKIKSICRQLITVWKNYMNIVTSAGISNLGKGANDFWNRIKEAYHNLSMQFIFGREGVYSIEFNERYGCLIM